MIRQGISRGQQARFIRAAEDYAAQFAQGAGGDPARYVAEIADAHGYEWEWIGEYLRRHPELMTGTVPTMAQRDVLERQRRADSARLADQAHDAYEQGRLDDAAALMWQASVLDPRRHDWDALWSVLDRARASR